MEQTGMVIAGGYLAVMAVIDHRYKKIPVMPGVVCMVFVALAQVVAGSPVREWLPGVGIGLFLLIVSRMSRGSIGAGDGLVYLVTGLALGFFRNLELLVISLLFASLAGLGLMVFRKVGRKYAMPFVPFTAVAYGMVLMI